ncbi:VQ motif-containing protein 11 [Salvia hispanica]|uniref:VQ motif-containing protein 11 n=1 Tax=Salvia hispanica TaxID=49212 RepID=UPI00200977F0|nr:VQ motif-containing protein 11 [Salvia hispanica]
MAASSPNHSSHRSIFHDPDTTFVQTDPETFREVVQRLTGASRDSAAFERRTTVRKLKIKLGAVMESPVSTLEYAGSPATPSDEEERAIAEKGFYLHPNPFGTPPGSDPPELLPLFPLHSPIN